MMVKLMVMFRQPENQSQFESSYAYHILPYLEKLPGIQRRQANMILGSPSGRSDYYRILELYFESYEALDAAMTSENGQKAGERLMKHAGDIVELLFVDVFEDNNPPA